MWIVSQPKLLTWNAKQVDISNLLDSGLQTAEVAKQAGVSKATVTKVANAKKKGQSPLNKYIPHLKEKKNVVFVESPPSEMTGAGKEIDPKQQQQKPVPGANANASGTGALKIPNTDATLLLLKPVPQTCALTPIMLNARYTAITEMNWPEDVSWEDFFDTVLVYCFKYWGFALQGVYKLDKKGDSPQSSQSAPTTQSTVKGNGHKDDAALKETAQKLGLAIMSIMQGVDKETGNAS